MKTLPNRYEIERQLFLIECATNALSAIQDAILYGVSTGKSYEEGIYLVIMTVKDSTKAIRDMLYQKGDDHA